VEKQKILIDYFEKTNMIADLKCASIYVQVAKDCVELLKKVRCIVNIKWLVEDSAV